MVLIKIPLEQYMNTEMVEQVLQDVTNCAEEYSLGFRRYIYLPDDVRHNMNVAQLLLEGKANAHVAIKAFLATLSDGEYKQWLMQQNSGI